MYDVIISGAGPAGSQCAKVIAENGFRVALIEKDINWRKPCGGGISDRIINKYYPELESLNPTFKSGAVLFSAQYNELEYNWDQHDQNSIVMDRLELDNFLRNAAVKAGAELFNKTISYDFIIENKKKIGIKTKTSDLIKEYKGKIIIIADGMSSKLAVKSGLRVRWNIKELGLAKCAILEGKTNLDIHKLYIFFRAYQGYGWIFPIDNKRFNIGCGTFGKDNLKYNLNKIYDEFLNNPNIKNLIPQKDYNEIWKGSYPLSAIGVLEKSLYDENIMIIGDAAGFVSPISGEGIHASVVSGQIAGETAVYALRQNNISKQTLKRYKQHPNIKKIINNFKLKRSLVEFFYQDKGLNLDIMFNLAEKDNNFKTQVINMFFFNTAPSKEFFLKITNYKK